MTGRFLDVTPEQYHRDPCEAPSLSSSIAGELVLRSPLHAWQAHPRLGGGGTQTTTAALNDGTLIHALVLDAGHDRIEVLDVDNFRTKAAKEQRDAAVDAGKCIVKRADYDAAVKVAEKIKARLKDDYGITLAGNSEQVIEWKESTEEHGDVLCRAMLDHLVVSFDRLPRATIYDLKSIRSADKRTCRRHILEYGYDIQEPAYRSAVAAAVPEVVGRIDFVFLFAELDPPYAVTPLRLDGMWREIAAAKWMQAVRTWARCMKTKKWPAYVEKVESIDIPPWALTGT